MEEIIADEISVEHLFVGDLTVDGDELEQKLVFESQVVLQNGIIRTSQLLSPSFKELLQTQWQLLHHDDFESDTSLVGWNIPYRSYCSMRNIKAKTDDESTAVSQQQDHFLTTHCAPHQTNLSKTFSIEQSHQHIKIQAEVHVFGDWNGESVVMFVDDKVAWSRSFHGTGMIETPCPNLIALSVPVEAIVDTTSPQVRVDFLSTQKRHPCDGSFAIDDLIVYLK